MKRLQMAIALTAVFSISAFAGDMHGTDSPAPTPGGTPAGISANSLSPTTTTPADMPTGDLAGLDSSLSAFLTVLGLVV
jgi:hypothetical protein